MPPPPSSKAWAFFKRNADSKVKCKLYECELVYTGGTSNMLNNLKLKHPSDFSETPEKAKQSSMNEFVNSPRSRRFSPSKSDQTKQRNTALIVIFFSAVYIRPSAISTIDILNTATSTT